MTSNDRDEKGRFCAGTPGGPGRPPRPAEEKYLRTMTRVVKLKDWRAICERARADALAGDARARAWLSDYLLGKPNQRVPLDVRIEASHQEQEERVRATLSSASVEVLEKLISLLEHAPRREFDRLWFLARTLSDEGFLNLHTLLQSESDHTMRTLLEDLEGSPSNAMSGADRQEGGGQQA
jgi:hypothetical protein